VVPNLSDKRILTNFFETRKVSFPTARTFATTSRRLVELPESNATPNSSIPPVTPKRSEGGTKAFEPLSQEEKSAHAVAFQNRKVGGLTETYTAYGVTEELYKECSRQADYSIPQARDDNAEVPKTEEGEDLGVGGGWWHDGEFFFFSYGAGIEQ
jgi:cytochrome b pre-mRNA-processing protein 3